MSKLDSSNRTGSDRTQTTDARELETRLRRCYDEQVARFPRTAAIGWRVYRGRNLPTALRNARRGVCWLHDYALEG